MSERYCEHNRERDSCGNNNCPYCKVESLQKELEAVKESLKTAEQIARQATKDNARVYEENEVLKLTIEHYKSGRNAKF